MPPEIRRNSRMGGRCVGGVGGCYWVVVFIERAARTFANDGFKSRVVRRI